MGGRFRETDETSARPNYESHLFLTRQRKDDFEKHCFSPGTPVYYLPVRLPPVCNFPVNNLKSPSRDYCLTFENSVQMQRRHYSSVFTGWLILMTKRLILMCNVVFMMTLFP